MVLADGRVQESAGRDSVYVHSLDAAMPNVLIVPCLENNLMSVSCLVKQGFKASFSDSCCTVEKAGKLATAPLKNGLYVLQDQPGCVKESGACMRA